MCNGPSSAPKCCHSLRGKENLPNPALISCKPTLPAPSPAAKTIAGIWKGSLGFERGTENYFLPNISTHSLFSSAFAEKKEKISVVLSTPARRPAIWYQPGPTHSSSMSNTILKTTNSFKTYESCKSTLSVQLHFAKMTFKRFENCCFFYRGNKVLPSTIRTSSSLRWQLLSGPNWRLEQLAWILPSRLIIIIIYLFRKSWQKGVV